MTAPEAYIVLVMNEEKINATIVYCSNSQWWSLGWESDTLTHSVETESFPDIYCELIQFIVCVKCIGQLRLSLRGLT
jgi:hypothetical protein